MRYQLAYLIVVYILTLAVRIAAVSHGNFPFWFDVGRDAIVSREIIEQRDFKIQGPTASSTNDAVYHGVLYYYLIGPLYTLFGGNPQYVLYGLIAITSLSVIPLYGLALAVTKKQSVAQLTGVLWALSYESVRATTWLSNPALAMITIPIFFLLVWKVFFEYKFSLFPWLTFVLALSQQAAVFFVVHWGLVFGGLWYAWQSSRFRKKVSWKTVGWGALTYGLGISTMLLAQLKAWQAGIFNLNSILHSTSAGENTIQTTTNILSATFTKLTQVLTPSFPMLSLVLVTCLIVSVTKKPAKLKIFIALIASSPLWLWAWHHRLIYHNLFGLEMIAVVLFAWWLQTFDKKRLGRVVKYGLIVIFILSNILMWKQETSQGNSLYFVPRGAYYRDLRNAVEFMYQQANGDQFSISTLTNPYGYNTTWAYILDWYGNKRYGYEPLWYGPNQAGLFGGDLLERTASPSATHFAIEEPRPGIDEWMYVQFEMDQAINAGTPSATRYFGTLKVIEY